MQEPSRRSLATLQHLTREGLTGLSISPVPDTTRSQSPSKAHIVPSNRKFSATPEPTTYPSTAHLHHVPPITTAPTPVPGTHNTGLLALPSHSVLPTHATGLSTAGGGTSRRETTCSALRAALIELLSKCSRSNERLSRLRGIVTSLARCVPNYPCLIDRTGGCFRHHRPGLPRKHLRSSMRLRQVSLICLCAVTNALKQVQNWQQCCCGRATRQHPAHGRGSHQVEAVA